MPNNMQNLVILMEPSKDAHRISLKGGKMCLNRFGIDEDAAFELSGVYYLDKSPEMTVCGGFVVERKPKGKGY